MNVENDVWVIVVALAGGLFAIWKALKGQIGDLGKGFDDRSSRMETRLGERSDRMEERISERVTRVDNRLASTLRDFMTEVKSILVRGAGSAVSQSESPITLTPLGKTVSRETDATKWAQTTAQAVSDEAGDKAYTIQEYCFRYVIGVEFEPDLREAIGKAAYDHGLAMESVLRVLAIELRDELLKRAGLDASD